MTYNYTPENVCPSNIKLDIDGNIVRNIEFTGGCNGNLKTIQRLLDGMTVEQIEGKCKGVTCGRRPTSCSDQLAIAVLDAFKSINVSK